MTQPDRSHLFFSYARVDSRLVGRITELLSATSWRPWVDRVDIPSASEWMAEIRSGIEESDGFVYVMTPHSIASRMCRVELSIAVDLSKRVLPLWVLTRTEWDRAAEAIEMDGADLEVPEELAELDFIDINDFTSRADPLAALVDELVRAAEQDLVWLRRHTRLQQDVKQWELQRFDEAALMRGPLLAEALEMLDAVDKDPPLSPLQRDFISLSRVAELRAKEREADQLAKRIRDLPPEQVAVGVSAALEGIRSYVPTPSLLGALRTLLARWPQRWSILHEGGLTSAVFSPDGDSVVTATAEGVVRELEARSGALIGERRGAGAPFRHALPVLDGRTVAVACEDGFVRFFSLDTEAVWEAKVAEGPVTRLATDPERELVAAVSGRLVSLVEPEAGRHDSLPEHPAAVTSVQLPSATLAVTTCEDGLLRLYDQVAERFEHFGLDGHEISGAVVSPDAAWMVIGGSFPGLALMERERRSIVNRWELGGNSATVLAASDDGSVVAAADLWGRVRVFTAPDGGAISERGLFSTDPRTLAMNGSGTLYVGGSRDGMARVSNLASDYRWDCPGHDGPVPLVQIDRDSRLLLTAGEDQTVRVHEIGRFPATVPILHEQTIHGSDISPDGRHVVTIDADAVVRIIDADDGREVGRRVEEGERPVSASFSAEDEVLIAFDSGLISFLAVPSCEERAAIRTGPIDDHTPVRLVHGGAWVAVGWEATRVVEKSTGAMVQLSRDSRAAVLEELAHLTGARAAGARIRAEEGGAPPLLEFGESSAYLTTRDHQVTNAWLSPDGQVVVGNSLNSNDAPLFDATSGAPIGSFELNHPTNHVQFSADGSRVLARWLSVLSVILYPSEDELVARARAQLHRTLSDRERAEFGFQTEQTEDGPPRP